MSEHVKKWRRPRTSHKPPPAPTAAKVRFRIKGQTDGPIYQGQKIVTPCRTCRK